MDLVVVDVVPESDGLELIEVLRRRHAAVPSVLAIATRPVTTALCLRTGLMFSADDVLHWPCTPEDLLDRVERLFRTAVP